MANSKDLLNSLVRQIELDLPPEEIRQMAYVIMGHHLGLSRAEILMGTFVRVTPSFDNIINRINQNEPVQYVLNEAIFYGRAFFVDNRVLIPRPETEQLTDLILVFARRNFSSLNTIRIADIGTGSGCIPITLSLELGNADAIGFDLSEGAIAVAKRNAATLQAHVHFSKYDVLTESFPAEALDIIVSNPPYVTTEEKPSMNPNVLNYEPKEALFVPDNRPLIYYEAIGRHARTHLSQKGLLAFEINERFGADIVDFLTSSGFSRVDLQQDLSGKDRFILAQI
jgi:release factor glutamine methyltransferase